MSHGMVIAPRVREPRHVSLRTTHDSLLVRAVFVVAKDEGASSKAVVEAAGLDRFGLLGVSQGGGVAIRYAADHPDRGSRMLLCGTYAKGRLCHLRLWWAGGRF